MAIVQRGLTLGHVKLPADTHSEGSAKTGKGNMHFCLKVVNPLNLSSQN